jgi:hypothetical protein
MSTKKQSDPRGFFLIWAILGLTFVLLSSHITSSQYARFVSQASGSDGARVIKFGQLEIKEEGPTSNVFAPGVPIENDFLVSFGGSEASTIVFIAVDAPNWKVTDIDENNKKEKFTDPTGQISWTVAADWTYLQPQTENNGTYVYYIRLAPNATLANKSFINDAEMTVSGDGTVLNYHNYNTTYNGNPISLSVKGYVVQSNGFSGPEAAWDSVKNKS